MRKRNTIVRYTAPERINHWVTAFCFILAAVSGLGFLFPSFNWLMHIMGTPQLARIVHPFVGVVMFASFIIMFFRYWHHNLIVRISFGRRIFVRSSLTTKSATPDGITSARNAFSGRRLSSWCCCW